MWCVVYAGDRNEQKTEHFVTHLLQGKARAKCFSLERDRLYKNSGVWHNVRERLFPGYVFIDTDEPETVYKLLEQTSKSLLFSDGWKVCVLDQGEETLLESIMDQNGRFTPQVCRSLFEFSVWERNTQAWNSVLVHWHAEKSFCSRA